MGSTRRKKPRRKRKLRQPARKAAAGGRDEIVDIPSVEDLIEQGHDPIHAAYIVGQHITSHFAEHVSTHACFRNYSTIVGEAEDAYLPSGPPISPLTGSYFTSWAFFDLQFDGEDTLATCLLDSADDADIPSDLLRVLRNLADSRMGVYEHIGFDGRHVRLRELITDDEFICFCTSGYRGKTGELWYARLLPPLMPDVARYHIVFTTPYVLIETTKGDWLQFLKRSMFGDSGTQERARLQQLLKHGPEPGFWNEFVFQAYHHHQHDAIFLAGIPDLKATLPHA